MWNNKIGTDIDYAIHLLKKDKLVAIPTETVYGLAANALSIEALKKIFLLKKRPSSNPLILHTHSINEIKKYVLEIPEEIELLIKAFSPGPITFLLPKKPIVPNFATAGSNLVAIRIPQHQLLLNLLQKIDFPLAAPSANQYGYISPTNAQDVSDTMQCSLPYILDGGSCIIGIESTIVEYKENKIILHREGGISYQQIKKITSLPIIYNFNTNTNTPGKSYIHYAPKTKFLIGNIESLLQETPSNRIGILSFNKSYLKIFPEKIKKEIILSPNGTLEEVAQNLYKSLLTLDKQNLDYIIGEFFDDNGIGKALNDRIKRASFKKE